MAFDPAKVPAASANLSGNAGFGGFPGPVAQSDRLIVPLVVGSMAWEVNSNALIRYLVPEGRVNLLYFAQVLSHHPRS